VSEHATVLRAMVSAMPDARKYSDDEVREILERALSSDGANPNGLAHADLVAIGEQVGVTPEAMTRAAEQVAQAKLDTSAMRSLKSGRRKLLAVHAALFAVVNALLFTVNFLTTPGEWWFLFSVVFWGLALAAHAGLALGLGVSARSLEREKRKLRALPQYRNQKLRIDAAAPERDATTPAVTEHDDSAAEPSRSTSRS
jgi:hypothetical protein